MKRTYFYKIIFLLLLFSIYGIGYGNSNTREDCESFLDSARKEFINGNYSKSLEFSIKARTLAQNNNWQDFQIRSLNTIGVIYKEILDYDKAMEYFLEAYKMALAISDKAGEFAAYNNIAILYDEETKYDKAIEYYQKAYDIAAELKDTSIIIRIAINLASVANEINDTRQADKYINIAMEILNNNQNDHYLPIVRFIEMETLYLKKEYNAAKELGLEILKEYQNIDYDDEPYKYKSEFLCLLSKVYQKMGDIENAIYYAHEALEYNPFLNNITDIYEQLSTLYQEKNSFVLALQYKDSTITAINALNKINNKKNLESNHILFELLNSEKELAESKVKQKSERILFISLFVFIVILTVASIAFLRYRSAKNKYQKTLELEKEKNEKIILQQQLKEQKTLALLEQERLSNEIDTKNRQLTAKILSKSNKNELVKEMIKELSSIPDKSKDPILGNMIRKLKLQLKDSKEWNNFLIHFEQINPMLVHSLKEAFPKLTANDIQLLSCLYLNLDTRKTAHLLNVSIQTYNKKKQRVANKMGLKASELYDHLIKAY